MLLLIQYTLIFSSVLTLVALGGCISEHSGVINLGLEGIMVIGALGGALVMSNLAALPGPLLVILSVQKKRRTAATHTGYVVYQPELFENEDDTHV